MGSSIFSLQIKYMGSAFFITNIDKARQIQLKKQRPSVQFIQILWRIQNKVPILKKLYQILNNQNLISQQNIYSLCIQAYITLVQINQINNEIERGTLIQQEQFKRSDIRKFIQKIDIISIYFLKYRQNKIKLKALSANKSVFRSYIDEEQILKQIANHNIFHNNIFKESSQNQEGKIKKFIQIHEGGIDFIIQSSNIYQKMGQLYWRRLCEQFKWRYKKVDQQNEKITS
ncbi:unnamed protein product [Paramecium primaurelia]|uniref:Uncharacterized protein n=1 Tax=Paramecium primaurelia TaxID=5886 RepID=A0A8S1KSK1_PARPR|nr:unnamed protein product [Paramecium primaurelia]